MFRSKKIKISIQSGSGDEPKESFRKIDKHHEFTVLEELLRNPVELEKCRKSAILQYSPEVIACYEHVSKYENLSTANDEGRKEIGMEICESFILEESSDEVNITAETKKAIIEAKVSGKFDYSTFFNLKIELLRMIQQNFLS